ncbi:similar to lipase [Plenodomus lingam JN3]|uniref:Carboxylic ester hydrolase n=2 Tax=Leptosphaeria maculans TaxID=5022 RepID=E5AFS8_LEPMJ|nr:similar to lipase [Plenodomus lingam JN3]CBY02067.1 similar to lipase [Plenodomus lingam JN3]
MRPPTLLLAALTLTLSPTPTLASQEIALQGYGRFLGTTISTSLTNKTLATSVDAWLGIDFASQPVGEARFAVVGPPAPFEGVREAGRYGLACVQWEGALAYGQGEACLNMNVFRTKGVADGEEKLPVLVWVHGGGFVTGSARSFDGPSFVANSKEPMIVVTFNYRLNSLGFLPSPAMERLGLLNLGLRDQETLFQFVQAHISAFGGDPERVTLGGHSAGAHSVGIHLFHNYNKTAGPAPLFSQAILESGSVTARSFPSASYPLYQAQFARYLDMIGCGSEANSSDASLLSCLRSAPIDAISNASTTVFFESNYAITWPFQPTLGGPLFEQRGSASGVNGNFYSIPIITTNVRDEGKWHAPGDLVTNDDFLGFLHNLLPNLSAQDLSDLAVLYPDPATTPISDSPYAYSPNSTQYDRISAALSDYMYICPGQETAVRLSAAESSPPVFKLNFAVNNTFPPWQGIPHTADGRYIWAEQGGVGGVQHPDVGTLLHSYLANFVVSGDPNGKGGMNSNGLNGSVPATPTPYWPPYVDAWEEGKPGLQLVMRPFGQTAVESDAGRRVQCEWWRDAERAVRLEK